MQKHYAAINILCRLPPFVPPFLHSSNFAGENKSDLPRDRKNVSKFEKKRSLVFWDFITKNFCCVFFMIWGTGDLLFYSPPAQGAKGTFGQHKNGPLTFFSHTHLCIPPENHQDFGTNPFGYKTPKVSMAHIDQNMQRFFEQSQGKSDFLSPTKIWHTWPESTLLWISQCPPIAVSHINGSFKRAWPRILSTWCVLLFEFWVSFTLLALCVVCVMYLVLNGEWRSPIYYAKFKISAFFHNIDEKTSNDYCRQQW